MPHGPSPDDAALPWVLRYVIGGLKKEAHGRASFVISPTDEWGIWHTLGAESSPDIGPSSIAAPGVCTFAKACRGLSAAVKLRGQVVWDVSSSRRSGAITSNPF